MADDNTEGATVDPQTPETTTETLPISQREPETIKLGEKEYSTEELNKLVGLGEQAVELETRWDTKLDRLMPEYSKTREEIKTLKQQQEEASKAHVEEKQTKGEELTEEEQIAYAKGQLKKLNVMTNDDFEDQYAKRRSGEKLYEKVQGVVANAQKEGLPKVTEEELITFMINRGLNGADPQDGYELMFKKQIREIEMQKLQELKPAGLQTQTGSTAGAKTPTPVTITKDNLGDMLTSVLTRGGGQ